jgi:hypothetical protein
MDIGAENLPFVAAGGNPHSAAENFRQQLRCVHNFQTGLQSVALTIPPQMLP